MRLPPGQRPAELERFGLPGFARRRVQVPDRPVLTVTGEVLRPAQVEVAALLAGLPRRDQRSDLHCVTTWSALDLDWSGVALAAVLGQLAELVGPHPRARWLLATGLDGYVACLALEDALAGDALLADRLDGTALTAAHGAPVRLVAPAQYGYQSVKGLVALEFRRRYVPGSAGLKAHRRGRVAAEERSRLLPGPVWRPIWSRALPLVRRTYRDGTA
jgi:DMSO/TMAO reductase YedYZ molybdopterin-dependent catalytic subunit